jgi:ABC-type multidrug transport system fused ATPase/permease subunit
VWDLSRLPRQASRYLDGFTWLLHESLRVAPKEWRRVVIATLVLLAGNAALLAAIFMYVRLLERNQVIQVLHVVLQPRESLLLLGGFTTVIFLGLVTIAVSEYIARTAALRIHRCYQEEAARMTLRVALRLPDSCVPEAAALTAATGLRPYYTEYARSCGWTMRFMANAFPALALLSVAFVLLLWLDPAITLIVFLLGLLLVAAQYPSSLFAADASNVVDQTRAEVNQRLQALATRIEASPPHAAQSLAIEDAIERFYDDPVTLRHQRAQQDRYRALELSALTMQAGGAVALALLLFIVVRGLLMEGGDWAKLAVYAALLRQLLGNATNTFRAMTVFSRFSPHINALRLLVTAVSKADARSPTPMPAELPIHAMHFEEQGETAVLRRGEIFFLVTRRKLGRTLAIELQAMVLEANKVGAGHLGAACRLPDISCRPRARDQAADPRAVESAISRWLEQSNGILLMDIREYRSLEPAARKRVAQCMERASLALVSARPPKTVPGNALVLVGDAQGRWRWLRTGEKGLAEAQRQEMMRFLQRTRANGSGVPDRDLDVE